jgi:hypothetical protein
LPRQYRDGAGDAHGGFSRGQQLQQEIAERGQFFGWQALVLFLVSLALVLLFTRMIIGPVKGIERMINRLGEGNRWGYGVYRPARAALRRAAHHLAERASGVAGVAASSVFAPYLS